jgi:hypothetical protein
VELFHPEILTGGGKGESRLADALEAPGPGLSVERSGRWQSAGMWRQRPVPGCRRFVVERDQQAPRLERPPRLRRGRPSYPVDHGWSSPS